MTDFNCIREFLAADKELNALVGDNIFLFERPKEVECDSYITYSFHELHGASAVRQYQLDIRAISKDIRKVLLIKDRVIKLLDCYNRPCNLSTADEGVLSCTLVNGGGLAHNDETDEYYAFSYFVVNATNN